MMIKRIFLLFFSLIIVVMVCSGGLFYWLYQKTISTPLKPDNNEIISVQRGENVNTVSAQLQKRGIIINQWAAIVYARLHGQASQIKAGDYRISHEMTLPDLFDHMAKGQVAVYNITVVEGKTIHDLLAELARNPNIKPTLQGKTPEEIVALLKMDGNLEGWFLPETYQFNHNTTDLELLERMKIAMHRYLTQAWEKRAPNLPLNSPYEALILASIVEKETGQPDERKQVAGVFIRRLQKGMLLQTDPTVIYGAQYVTKNYDGKITRSHLKTDTPYNTYIHKGLPPTPIALPSKASIDATLHPDNSDTLYFVADGKGGHTFSSTYDEHKKAVAHYREWLNSQQP